MPGVSGEMQAAASVPTELGLPQELGRAVPGAESSQNSEADVAGGEQGGCMDRAGIVFIVTDVGCASLQGKCSLHTGGSHNPNLQVGSIQDNNELRKHK